MRACATCPCDARGCTVVLRALSVCTVVHMVLFRAWGRGASESLGRGQQNAAPPLLCTLAVQEGLCAQTPGEG